MHSHQLLVHHHRGHLRHVRRRRLRSAPVRYTLLAPPARLTPEEAAALLRLPRRVLRADLEWFVPGLGETTSQPPLELGA